MLRDFFYSITTLIYWVLAHYELYGIDILKNEGRCSFSFSVRLPP